MISHIVATSHNRVIGKSNDLPWYLPADLQHFKRMTTGHPVIMGRKTYDSIFARLGKALPARRNIVVSRRQHELPGVEVYADIDDALDAAQGQEIFIIGGASIYESTLDRATKLYVTEIEADIDGDTLYPNFLSSGEWHEVSRENHASDDRNEYDYSFVTYERVG